MLVNVGSCWLLLHCIPKTFRQHRAAASSTDFVLRAAIALAADFLVT